MIIVALVVIAILALTAIQFVTGSVDVRSHDFFAPLDDRRFEFYDVVFLMMIAITLIGVHRLLSRSDSE